MRSEIVNKFMVNCLITAVLALWMSLATAEQTEDMVGTYDVHAGDILSLQVWNEPTLSAE